MKKIISVILAVSFIISAFPMLSSAKEIVVFQNFDDYESGATEISTDYCSVGGMSGSSFEVKYAPRSQNKALHVMVDAVESTSSAVAANTYLTINRSGKVSVEFRMMPTDFTQTTVGLSTRGGSTKTFLIMSNGTIKPYTGNPSSTLNEYAVPYDMNDWFTIKLAVDTDVGTYDFYFNNKLIGEGIILPGGKEYYKESGIYQGLIQRYVFKGNYSEAYIDDLKVTVGDEKTENSASKILEEGEEDLYLKWSPSDKTVTYQNPPLFAWPVIPMCENYVLQLSRKEDMSEIEYEYNIENSVFSPNHTLDTGVWYWRVNGTNINGTTEWSNIKRFRIDQSAWEYVIPSPEEMKAMIKPEHPRLWLDDASVKEYKEAIKSGYGKETYDSVKKRVDKNLSITEVDEPVLVYPENATSDEKTKAKQNLRNDSSGKVDQMYEAAMIYIMTEEQKYADKALKFLDSISGWDPDGFTSYATQDQVHRNIAFKCAIVYDWLYPLISDELKQKVLAMVEERVETMYVPLMLQHPLDKLPYDSHGKTASSMIFLISIALMNDIPRAEVWFEKLQPVYLKVSSWGGEDGGYSNGTSYSQPIGANNNDAVATATGFNPNMSVATRNKYKYYLYFQTPGSPFGSFGDEANILPVRSITTITQHLMYAEWFNNTAAKWAAETQGALPWKEEPLYIKYYKESDVEAIPPFDHFNAYHDRQLGWVSMTSDIINPLHTGIRFKSSWWGSYNHSHADQNSFTLYSEGEPLLVDSGYFDYYNSAHDKNYSHKTLAHNAITYNGGKGQYHGANPENNINSKGDITGYLYGEKFNLVSGDAERAYTEFDKANRHVIYLKPDYAIVVDELSSNNDIPMQYEFNLKGYSPFVVDKENQKAILTRGRAKVSATFQYPKAADIEEFDVFIGIDGKEYRPAVTALPRRKDHYGVRFDTEKTSDTVMVTTLDILKSDEQEKEVQVNSNDECMEIIVDNIHKIYVRLDMTKDEVNYGNISFKGSAAVFNEDSFMLVNGTELTKDGVTLISADIPGNFSYETGEIHIYNEDDGNVSFKLPFAVSDIKNEKGVEIKRMDSEEYDYNTMPYKWSQGDDKIINIAYDAGEHNIYLNGTPPMKYEGLNIRINGRPVEYKNFPFLQNGTTYVPLDETVAVYDAKLTVEDNKYTVTKDEWKDSSVTARAPRTMTVYADSASANFNGNDVTLNKPTILRDGLLYIPLRAYYEVFTERIGWSDYAKTAWVYTEEIYKDDMSSSSWPRTDIMTEAEYEEYLQKK